MMPVTMWYRRNEEGIFEFNHIQNYHTDDDKPAANFDNQKKAWKNGTWRKAFAYLANNNPPKIMHPAPQWREDK